VSETPKAGRRDIIEVQRALGIWLATRPGYAGAEVRGLTRPSGAGLSNETYLFECHLGPRCESLVMQVGPAGAGLFRDYDLVTMARIQQRIGAVTTIPVARVRWVEPDATLLGAPFYVMDKVDGRVPSDNPSYHGGGFLGDMAPADQVAAWEAGIAAMVQLHALDPVRDGFDFLVDAPWGMALDAEPALRRVQQWRDLLAWGSRWPVPFLHDALDRLEASRPPQTRPRVHWGDAKISNCVLQGAGLRALLDWELCGLSDPQEDLSFWLVLDWAQWRAPGLSRLPHLPSPQATVDTYARLAGQAQPDVLWWFQFGMARLAIIYHRFLERRMDAGRLAPDADVIALNPMCALLTEALAMEELP